VVFSTPFQCKNPCILRTFTQKPQIFHRVEFLVVFHLPFGGIPITVWWYSNYLFGGIPITVWWYSNYLLAIFIVGEPDA